MGQRKTRSIIIILCAVVSFAVTVGGIRAVLVAAEVEGGAVGIGIGRVLELHAANLEAAQRVVAERIVVLGDSTVIDYPRGRTVPDNLRRVLRNSTSQKTLVIPLAVPGIGALEYYAFADRIVAEQSHQVVLPINLASLSGPWRNDFNRTESSGWIPLRRHPHLMTRPFHSLGLTFDRVLFYMGIVGAGFQETWQHFGEEQVRAVHGIHQLRRVLHQFNPRLMHDGLPGFRLPYQAGNRNRSNRHYVDALYGAALSGAEVDHPVVQMLAGALEVYQSAGIHVLAYAVPMNVEHFEEIGFDTRTGTRQTIEMLRNLVESRGGTFLDLHRLFPDNAFKDLGGHFLQEEGFDGALLLARELAPDLLRHLPRRALVPAGQTE
jgi:hypothetical protein